MAKTSSKKKGAAKKKSASKAKSSPQAKKGKAKGAANSKSAAGKAPPKKGKKGAVKDLLLKSFDTWQPETLYTPPEQTTDLPPAPAIAAGENADQVKALLLKRFDAGPASSGKPPSPKKKATPAKPKAPAKPPAEKAAPPPKKAGKAPPPKKPSTRELLDRRFDAWVPEERYAPTPEKVETPPAPPIAAGADADRVKRLLLKTIDLSAPAPAPVQPPAAEAPEPANEPPKEPVSIGELRQRQFDSWRPDKIYVPPKTVRETPAAPPIAEGEDAERVRGLLFRQFDLSDVAAPAAEAAPSAGSEEPVVPESKTEVPEEVKAPEAVKAQEAKEETAPEAEPAQAVPKSPTEVPEEVKVPGEVAAEEAKAETAPQSEPSQAVPKASTEVPEEVKVSGEVAAEEARAEATPSSLGETAASPLRPEPVYRPEAEWETPGPAAEEAPQARVPPTPPYQKGSDPMQRSMTFLAAIAIVLFAIIIGTSFSNASRYYLKSTDDALEIWKGSFAPMGDERVIRLEGLDAPETIQGVYTKKQVMPIAFNYYMDKAEDLFYSEGLADYEEVQEYLEKALVYADAQTAKQAYAMQKNMKILSLMTMADVAASRATPAGYRKAIDYLEQAAKLDSSDLIAMNRTRHAPIIEKKLAAYQELLAEETPAASETEGETPTIEATESD